MIIIFKFSLGESAGKQIRKKKKKTEKFTKVAGYKINMKKANSFTMYNK